MLKKIIIIIGGLMLILNMMPIKKVNAVEREIPSAAVMKKDRSYTRIAPPAAINAIFPDPNLAEVIRDVLGKSSVTDTVTGSELSSIAAIEAMNKNIVNIEGLQYIPNPFLINLQGNNIIDLSPLGSAYFPALQILTLSNNPIGNFSPLISLNAPILTELNLLNNQISDMSIFSSVNFPFLRKLNLSNNQINDISVFSSVNFPTLQSLTLTNNQISDISVFSSVNFPTLQSLTLTSNQISDIGVFSSVNFPTLQSLTLTSNQISDIGVFSSVNFPTLQSLTLTSNQISDISVFSSVNFPTLQSLSLASNQISDISPLSMASFPNLTTLGLDNQTILNQPVIWNASTHVTNNILEINGQPVPPSVMSDSGTYSEPILTWIVPKGTPSVSYTFTTPVTLFGASASFTGTVTQPLIEGYTINYLVDNQLYQTEEALFGQQLNEPTPPTKAGYRFLGWNTAANGTGVMWNFATDTVPNNNINLYAQWELFVENTGDQLTEDVVVPSNNDTLVTTGEMNFEYLIIGSSLLFGSIVGLFIVVRIRKRAN